MVTSNQVGNPGIRKSLVDGSEASLVRVIEISVKMGTIGMCTALGDGCDGLLRSPLLELLRELSNGSDELAGRLLKSFD